MQTENEFLLYHILKASYAHQPQKSIFEPDFEPDEQLFKNVCAKLHVELVDRIDSAIGLLDISKTQFIQAASIHLLENLNELLNKYDHPALKKGDSK
jgi:hypothetical protein